MNPLNFNHKTELLSTGRKYHFIDQIPAKYNPKSTPTLLCIHGFPDLWYGWRFQIGSWQKRYRVIVPDMLGYGQTDMPSESEAYSTKRLSDDLAALLDLLGIKKAVLIGHDWGAYIVGRFALWHPNRLLALVMLSVPYTPVAPTYIPIEEVIKRFKHFGYQAYFADEKSTAEINDNLSVFVPLLYSRPKSGLKMVREGDMRKLLLNESEVDVMTPCLLDDKELQYYKSQFKRGMLGPLSYYRTSRARYEEEQAAKLSSNLPPDLPVLFLYGTADPTCPQHTIRRSHEYIPRLQVEALEGRGHWLMIEAKDIVATRIMDWLVEVLDYKIRGKL